MHVTVLRDTLNGMNTISEDGVVGIFGWQQKTGAYEYPALHQVTESCQWHGPWHCLLKKDKWQRWVASTHASINSWRNTETSTVHDKRRSVQFVATLLLQSHTSVTHKRSHTPTCLHTLYCAYYTLSTVTPLGFLCQLSPPTVLSPQWVDRLVNLTLQECAVLHFGSKAGGFTLIDAQRLTRGRMELAPVRHTEFELTAAELWGVSPA